MKAFGIYKKKLEDILINSYTDKKLFKENFNILMGALKLSKHIREYYVAYDEISKNKFDTTEDASQYIDYLVESLKTNKQNIQPVLNILDKVMVKKANLIENTDNKIYQALDGLIFNSNITEMVTNTQYKKFLINHLLTKSAPIAEMANIPNSLFTNLLVTKFNNKFLDQMNESEKDLFKGIMTLKEKEVINQINTLKEGNIKKIDTLLDGKIDKDIKEKLNETKDVINNMTYDRINILNLSQLNKDLD